MRYTVADVMYVFNVRDKQHYKVPSTHYEYYFLTWLLYTLDFPLVFGCFVSSTSSIFVMYAPFCTSRLSHYYSKAGMMGMCGDGTPKYQTSTRGISSSKRNNSIIIVRNCFVVIYEYRFWSDDGYVHAGGMVKYKRLFCFPQSSILSLSLLRYSF